MESCAGKMTLFSRCITSVRERLFRASEDVVTKRKISISRQDAFAGLPTGTALVRGAPRRERFVLLGRLRLESLLKNVRLNYRPYGAHACLSGDRLPDNLSDCPAVPNLVVEKAAAFTCILHPSIEIPAGPLVYRGNKANLSRSPPRTTQAPSYASGTTAMS
jgi:hypothetical protein